MQDVTVFNESKAVMRESDEYIVSVDVTHEVTRHKELGENNEMIETVTESVTVTVGVRRNRSVRTEDEFRVTDTVSLDEIDKRTIQETIDNLLDDAHDYIDRVDELQLMDLSISYNE